MDKLKDVELHLGNNFGVSNLKKSVYEEELKSLNEKYPVNEDEININKTYIFKKQDVLEVGVFIRNGLSQNISFEKIGLALRELGGSIIAQKMENFKGQCVVPGRSAVPLMIEFPLSEVNGYDEGKDYVIQFINIEDMEAFDSSEVEIAGIDDSTSFEEEQEIRTFNYNLPTMKADQLNVTTFKIEAEGEDKLNISLFFRNAMKSTAVIEVLPISVVDKEGTVVAKALYKNPQGVISVESGKALLQTFVMPCKVKVDSETIKNLSVRFQ